jgi:hypothetical protein
MKVLFNHISPTALRFGNHLERGEPVLQLHATKSQPDSHRRKVISAHLQEEYVARTTRQMRFQAPALACLPCSGNRDGAQICCRNVQQHIGEDGGKSLVEYVCRNGRHRAEEWLSSLAHYPCLGVLPQHLVGLACAGSTVSEIFLTVSSI